MVQGAHVATLHLEQDRALEDSKKYQGCRNGSQGSRRFRTLLKSLTVLIPQNYETGTFRFLFKSSRRKEILTDRNMLPENNTIRSYFRAIKRKDIDNLVDMFEDEAVIHEPFSKEVLLRDKRDFRPFFQVICMAIEELERDLLIEDVTDEDGLSVLCTFHRGETVCVRFSFQFGGANEYQGSDGKKIQKLQIQFLNRSEFGMAK